jgi:uncharacterized membrane protein
MSRLFGSGWPVFWLAVPVLVAKYFDLPRKSLLRLGALHFLVSWIPFIIYSMNPESVPIVLSSVVLAFVFQVLAAKEIRKLSPADGAFEGNPSFEHA